MRYSQIMSIIWLAAPLHKCELPLLQYNKHYSEAGTQRGCNVISLGSFTEDSSSYFSLWFYGTVSRDGFFFKGLNILISTVCVLRWWFQDLSKASHFLLHSLTFYLFLWNFLLILNMVTETFLIMLFSLIGQCSPVPTSHWLQENAQELTGHRAASGMILQNHRSGGFLEHFQCRFRLLEGI
jgi:hypothetical protein